MKELIIMNCEEKMKVLLLDVTCRSGSTGKIVYDLYTSLNKDGHTAAICYGRGNLVNEPNIYRFSSYVEVCMHAFLTRLTGLNGCYSYFATQNLLKFISDFKPDVIHIHEIHGYFLNIRTVINYIKKNKIKTIWSFHSEFMYTGKCGHSYGCEKWKNECKKCPQVKEYPSSWLCDFSKKMFNDKKKLFQDFEDLTIVTPSKWLSDRVKQSFLFDKNIQVVQNGIDTKNIFYPRSFEHLKVKHSIKDEKIILAVAPKLMSEQKGGRNVIKLAERMRNMKVKFILIGVDDIKEKFDNNVKTLGRIEDQEELAAYYSMADITVLASKKESFSLVCAESLACGTPVVGFMAGAPETITIKEYSEFVEYKDVDKLYDATLKWLNRKSEVTDKLSKQANEKYSKEKMYNCYLYLYEKMR